MEMMEKSTSRTNGVTYLAALAALWVIFNYRVLFLGHTIVIVDSYGFFYPLWKWGAGVFQQGLIPLWCPDAGLGTPYLSDPEMECGYLPVRLLYHFFSPTTAFNASILGHHLFALFGFWFFARSTGFSKPASFLGSVLFGFACNSVSLTWSAAMYFTLSWLPLVFFSAYRLKEGKRGGWALFSFILAMQLSSGYPLFCYLTLLSLTLDLTVMALAQKDTGLLENKKWIWIWPYLSGVFTATVFNLFWLLPFADFHRFSNIYRRLDMSTSLGWSNLVTWVNPFFCSHPLHYSGGAPFPLACFFLGLPPVALLFWGALQKKMNKTAGWFLLLFVTLSLGNTAWLGLGLKSLVPFYHWVARSGYVIILTAFWASRFAMQSCETLVEKKEKALSTSWFVICPATYGLALLSGVPSSLTSFWLSLAFLLMSGVKTRFSVGYRWAFLILSLFFSLGPVLQSINFTMPQSYYDEKPVLCGKMTKPGRLYHSPVLVEKNVEVAGASVSDVYEILKRELAPNWPLAQGIEEVYFLNPIFLYSSLDWCYSSMRFSPTISRKVLDYLNVRYVLGRNSFGDLRTIASDDLAAPLSENLTPLPKWFSILQASVEGNREDDLRNFDKKDFGFEKNCFVSKPAEAGTYSSRAVSEVSRTVNQIEIHAEGSGKALLISSELNHPGWQSRTSGAWRDALGVNHGFRGVILEKDEESATVAYRPATFRLGLFSALLVCAFWAVMALKLFVSKDK